MQAARLSAQVPHPEKNGKEFAYSESQYVRLLIRAGYRQKEWGLADVFERLQLTYVNHIGY